MIKYVIIISAINGEIHVFEVNVVDEKKLFYKVNPNSICGNMRLIDAVSMPDILIKQDALVTVKNALGGILCNQC